jgi:MoxR-like ATPase
MLEPTPLQKIITSLNQVVIGKAQVIELVMTGLLADGHLLIEDVPGVGKTLLAKSLAVLLNCRFKRIQFTPDLTPTDVTGFYVYNRKTGEFVLRQGPVMSNILLADEINRTVPRTQSSLLEAMEERQVTIDGNTMPLPRPFLVMATQNPIEHEGTFLLPEAQLDRFLLKISMGYPSVEEEEQILKAQIQQSPLAGLQPVCSMEDILEYQNGCRQVRLHPSLVHYIVELISATRSHPAVALGASPRASLALQRASQALAFLRDRDYVIPDDIKYLAGPVLLHRLIVKREERLHGLTSEALLQEIIRSVKVPESDEAL